jgi:hypothetical protein
VGQELANVAKMLTTGRPDALTAAGLERGGDVLILSSLYIEPKFRGNMTGYTVLNAILATAGRNTAMVVLEGPALIADGCPEPGTLGHAEAKAAWRRYWFLTDSRKPTVTTSCSRLPPMSSAADLRELAPGRSWAGLDDAGSLTCAGRVREGWGASR